MTTKNKKSAASSKSSEPALPELSVRVRPMTDTSDRPVKLLAFAELTIANAFVIKGIRILRKDGDSEGPFVIFPAERGKNQAADRWFDVAHPVSAVARTAATAAILAAHKTAVESSSSAA